MRVLVIGSNGYMGRHLVQTLAGNDIAISGASSSDGSGVDAATGLLPTDYAVPEGTNAVVYMAQSPHYRDANQAGHVLSVNVVSAVRAAVAARAAGVRRFIYISTGTVYAPSFTPLNEASSVRHADWYGLSKIQGEQAVQMFQGDMDMHIVRPFGVYGPAQSGRLVPNLLSSVLAERPITLQGRIAESGDADGIRVSLCYIEDASKVLTHLITHGGPPVLNLAGDCASSIRELATILGDLVGKKPIFDSAPNPREFDLIADIALLVQTVPMRFTPLHDGLASLVRN